MKLVSYQAINKAFASTLTESQKTQVVFKEVMREDQSADQNRRPERQ